MSRGDGHFKLVQIPDEQANLWPIAATPPHFSRPSILNLMGFKSVISLGGGIDWEEDEWGGIWPDPHTAAIELQCAYSLPRGASRSHVCRAGGDMKTQSECPLLGRSLFAPAIHSRPPALTYSVRTSITSGRTPLTVTLPWAMGDNNYSIVIWFNQSADWFVEAATGRSEWGGLLPGWWWWWWWTVGLYQSSLGLTHQSRLQTVGLFICWNRLTSTLVQKLVNSPNGWAAQRFNVKLASEGVGKPVWSITPSRL